MINGSRGWILKALSTNTFEVVTGSPVESGIVHVVEYASYQKLEDKVREYDKDILSYHALKDLHQEVRNERNRLRIEVEGLYQKIWLLEHGQKPTVTTPK